MVTRHELNDQVPVLLRVVPCRQEAAVLSVEGQVEVQVPVLLAAHVVHDPGGPPTGA